MKKEKIILSLFFGGLALAIVLFLLSVLSIVPKPTVDNCEKITGQVANIREGEGDADIVISIKDDDNYYYINRGLERGLVIQDLKDRLTRAC